MRIFIVFFILLLTSCCQDMQSEVMYYIPEGSFITVYTKNPQKSATMITFESPWKGYLISEAALCDFCLKSGWMPHLIDKTQFK